MTTHNGCPTRDKVGHDPVEAKLSRNVETVDSFSIQKLWTGTVSHQVDYHAQVTLPGVSVCVCMCVCVCVEGRECKRQSHLWVPSLEN